jgi:hypothetical protein
VTNENSERGKRGKSEATGRKGCRIVTRDAATRGQFYEEPGRKGMHKVKEVIECGKQSGVIISNGVPVEPESADRCRHETSDKVGRKGGAAQQQPTLGVNHPLRNVIGCFANEPQWDELEQVIKENRRKLDET